MSAGAPALVYATDREPGIRRRRAGRGFAYYDADGRRITDHALVARLRALAIPPAWRDVWIAPDPRAHLQATGRDARGRKQYRYHPAWQSARAREKFSHVIDFAERLPALRRRLRQDLARAGIPRERVLAIVVSLLAGTLIRVGNEQYTRENRSFGLTTLRNRHLRFDGPGQARFRFRGKSGLVHEVTVCDPRFARLLRRCQELPGQHLFQYVDDAGAVQAVSSELVNAYLAECMGGSFTAKDFRTWGGTIRALAVLSALEPPPPGAGERATASRLAGAIREVAALLGNTPAICRASYVHPDVIAGWREDRLGAAVPRAALANERALERCALRFLRAAARRRRRPPTVQISGAPPAVARAA